MVEWRTLRKPHGNGRRSLPIPLCGENRGKRLEAGIEHRKTGSTSGTKMLGSFSGSSPCARTCDESPSSRNWPAPARGRPPQGVWRTAGHLPSPVTFPPVVVLADYHPSLLDGEAGFLLVIQSDTQHRAVRLCAHTRDVQHGPACTRRAQTLRGRKE